MKRKVTVLALAGLIPLFGMAAPTRFRAEVKPIGLITSGDVEDFGVRYFDGATTYSEIIDGENSYLGIAEVGVEFDAGFCFIDLLVGGGGTANGGFASGLLTADVGCRFKLDEEGTLAMGPFIGAIMATETEWEVREDGDEGTADLDGFSGLKAGVKLTAGWHYVSIIVEGGYARFGYDLSADNPGAWQYTRDDGATWIPLNAVGNEVEIEMDGFYGLIGACLHF